MQCAFKFNFDASEEREVRIWNKNKLFTWLYFLLLSRNLSIKIYILVLSSTEIIFHSKQLNHLKQKMWHTNLLRFVYFRNKNSARVLYIYLNLSLCFIFLRGRCDRLIRTIIVLWKFNMPCFI
jgi:hypothetical protein